MEDIEKALPQAQYSHIANMMIKQLRSGEINLEEYLMKCAYWGVKTLDDMYFRSLPSRPLGVIEYEQISKYKRQKLTQEFYVDNPEIMRYYDERDKVIRINKTNLWNLKTYKKYIPESDTASHEKLDERIMDFKIKIKE